MLYDSSFNVTNLIKIQPLELNNKRVFNGIYSFSNDFNVNNYVNLLISNLIKNKYHSLIQTYLSIINNKGLFSEFLDKKQIFDIYNKYTKIRNFIRRKIYIKKLKKCRFINDADLELNTFSSNDNRLLELYDIENKSIYRFRFTELIKIIKFSLLYRSIDYSTPKPIKNPYTNNIFNLKQLVQIYFFIKNQYFLYQKQMPSYLFQFSNSYFNIDIFNKHYSNNNLFKVHNEYIDSLDNDEWWCEFDEFIKVYPDLKKSFCKLCAIDKYPETFRLFFSSILTINFMNDSDIYNMGHAKDIYEYLSKKLGLYFNQGHSIIHSKNKRKRQPNRQPNRQPILRINTNLSTRVNLDLDIDLFDNSQNIIFTPPNLDNEELYFNDSNSEN
jgi:hypothetical protein